VAKTPSARSDNLIYVYGELPRAIDLAARVTRLSAGVVRTLTARPERMRAVLDAGLHPGRRPRRTAHARFDADYRTAHRVVQRAVRAGTGLDADGLAKAALDVAGREWRLDAAELAAALDPEVLVRSRTALGGAAPVAMRPMLDRVRREAAEEVARVDAGRCAIGAAEDAVRARAREVAGR
jgi:argininosuccinate lyase